MIGRPAAGVAAILLLVALLSALLALQKAGGETGSNRAGEFDYYTLVLSWSPTHCASDEGARDRDQCERRDGRRYAFVLHGLWPQHERGYPESCRTRKRPYVPEEVISEMSDIMPSRGLIIHEYRAHGTCSGLDSAAYFTLSRQLFDKVAIPERFVNPFETQFVAPDDLVDEFVDENPGLTPEMVAVRCGGPGSRLKDVRICFTREGTFRACGANESEGRSCRSRQMHVPPVRSTRTGAGASP